MDCSARKECLQWEESKTRDRRLRSDRTRAEQAPIAATNNRGRFSVPRKAQAVRRLLRGEDRAGTCHKKTLPESTSESRRRRQVFAVEGKRVAPDLLRLLLTGVAGGVIAATYLLIANRFKRP